MSEMAPNGTTWYRAAVYCGVAIMHFYRADISPFVPGESLGAFAERNAAVVKRVKDEMVSTFGYELSYRQMGAVLSGWCEPAMRLADSEPYRPPTPGTHSTGEETER